MKRLWILAVLLLSVNAVSQPPSIIPGITPSGLYVPLVDLGFTKSGPSIIKDKNIDHYRWELMAGDRFKIGYDFYIKLWGLDVNNIYRVSVHAEAWPPQTTQAPQQIKTLFGLVAALQYTNSTPQQASDWVVAHINDTSATRVFSDIEFSIDHLENSWNMVIKFYQPPEPNKPRGFILPGD